MKVLYPICFVFLFLSGKAIAQDLSAYKYVVVPKSYAFLDQEDKYQLNSLSVFLFQKYGFEAIMEGEPFPEGLQNNPCSALYAEAASDSGMFSLLTKVKVVLKNCNQQIVFESKEGRSRLKEYKFAYQEALRDAFSSVESLNHVYKKPSEKMAATQISKDENISKAPNPEVKNVVFDFNGNDYQLLEDGENWVLRKTNSGTTEAHLYKTNTENFVFRSEKINGTAYFDESGNLIVEFFDNTAGGMKKISYERKD